MLRAILFDMGGTLDGDGLHWLDRFELLYAAAGVRLRRETLREAFEQAERLAATDDTIARADLEGMVARHVGWQLAHLAIEDAQLCHELVANFVRPVREAAATNARLLASLASRGFRLGVVSNGCGNVDRLCDDLGYTAALSVIVDSRRVQLYKPDPAIYIHAAACLGLPPAAIMMVGDSFDRDVRPAKSIGMKTAWLAGPGDRVCPDPTLADVCLRVLADLPAVLDRQERTVA